MFSILALTCALVAVVLIALGVRGRRIDDHPHCRKCGYDLSGAGDGAASCPECGRSLRAARAVRVDRRRARRPLVAAGVALMLLGGGLGGAAYVPRSDLNDHKPSWLLLWELDNRGAAGRAAARQELFDRHAFGALTPSQVRRLAEACLDDLYDLSLHWDGRGNDVIEAAGLNLDRAPRTAGVIDAVLRIQADPDATWTTDLGNRVEWLRELEAVPDAKWEVYLRQSVDRHYSFSVPESVPPGATLQVRFDRGPPRLGTIAANRWQTDPAAPSLHVKIHHGSPLHGGRPVFENWGSSASQHESNLQDERDSGAIGVKHTLAAGTFVLELPVRYVISEVTYRDAGTTDAPRRRVIDTVTPVTTWTRTHELTLEVAGDALTNVDLIAEPARAAEVRAAISFRVFRSDEVLSSLPDLPPRRIEVSLDEPPVPLAFEVFLRDGERELRLGALSGKKCTACLFSLPVFWPDEEWLQDLDRADVVLRPDLEFAMARGMESIWSEEVVFQGVCLKRVAFLDAPVDEQQDRLRDAVDVRDLASWRLPDGRQRFSFTVELSEMPIPLDHQVECRFGERTFGIANIRSAKGGGLGLPGVFDLEAGASPPAAFDVVFTRLEQAGDADLDLTGFGSFTIEDFPLPDWPPPD